MGDDTDTPDGWTRIDDIEDDPRVERPEVYQRRRDGLVIAFERQVTNRAVWSAAALPENYYEDNQPIRHYGEDGYVTHADDLDTLRERAFEWMRENPRD